MYPQYLDFEKLETLHPECQHNQEMWAVIDDLICGGDRLKNSIDKFLIRKPDEEDATYKFRKKIFSYDPVLSQCITQLMNRMVVSNYVVEGLPTEGQEGEFWRYFRENLDGCGCKEKEFIKNLFLELIKYRKAFIVIDKPYTEETINSYKEEKERGLLPYLLVYGGKDVAHYGEEDGKLKWIKIRKLITDFSPVGADRTYLEYTFIDEVYMAQYRVEVEVSKDGSIYPKHNAMDVQAQKYIVPRTKLVEHERGCIPVIKIELPETLYVCKEAFYLVLEHIRVHNNLTYTSNVAGQIQRLFTPFQASTDTDPSEAVRDGKFQTGNDHVLIGQGFSFNETTGSAINTISSYLNKLEARIKDIVFSNGLGNGQERPMQESGVAKAMDFISQEQALQAYGEKLIDALEKAYRCVAGIRNLTDDEIEAISISGMNEFVLDSVDAKIDRITRLENLQSPISETAMRLVIADLQRALTPNASTLEQQQITKETEDNFVPDDFPEFEVMEVLSLSQNQIISEDSAREMLGFDPEVEKELIKSRMLEQAQIEQEVASIMGAGESKESEQATESPNEYEEMLTGTIQYFVSLIPGLTEQEVRSQIGYQPSLTEEELEEIIDGLIAKIAELTNTPIDQVESLVYGNTDG